MADSLGDRMKEKYERPFSYSIPGASPVVIRVDGKAGEVAPRVGPIPSAKRHARENERRDEPHG